ncbi:GAF domain-containing protein [Actinoplanes utahensis]|uniref:GAF domain-containing protein n=1 Tax=Actinoplanes utahensis TaxID=1869 RepID=UPI001378C260|nr:ATP-binding protein [Actinoplanes utahensis]
MPGFAGIGLSAGRDDATVVQTRFSSDAGSASLEAAQETFDDGPCRDATVNRRPVYAADLTDSLWRERWPRFTPAALDAGARSVFALPLHAGGVRHAGAVDMYRRTPGGLSGADLALASAFAAAAAEMVTLERLGLDWTAAFADARLGGVPDGMSPALPLARWFDRSSRSRVRLQVHAVSTGYGPPHGDPAPFVLAVHEAMVNAVQHGGGRGQLLLWSRNDRLWCEISDHGPGIGTTLRSARTRAGTRRRRVSGLHLMQRACPGMDLITDVTGTRVTLCYQP